MSHQDRTSDIVINHQTIKQVVDWLLAPALFAGMSVRKGATWKPRMLAVTALLWASSDLTNLTDRFKHARKIVARIFRWQLPPGKTYQGFLRVLRKWQNKLLGAIVPFIRLQMQQVLVQSWTIAGYVVFAVDGSRIELARTESLEAAFSPKKKQEAKKRKKQRAKRNKQVKRAMKGQSTNTKKQSAVAVEKKANSPQMWLTLLWHVGTGLPWAWRRGPSDSSERAHFEEMLEELPEKSLMTADAGFVGYDFWKAILDAGHDFVIRVGANVRLLKKLGYARQHEHTVYLWPDAAAKKKQPPLVLRLIVLQDGKHPVYLVTNLHKNQLSDRQAAMIYAARWGIELFFRTFKQTFKRRKLRSHAAKNATLELDWSLLALWCVCLLGQRELVENDEDPSRLSPASAIAALQSSLREWRVRPQGRDECLWSLLRLALLDDYDRTSSKTSRNYPRKKKRQRVGRPKITTATKHQINAAQELKQHQQEFQSPA
jgi:hypothetical protein